MAWYTGLAMARRADEQRLGEAFDKRVEELGAEAAILPITISKQTNDRVRFLMPGKDGVFRFSRWCNKGDDALAYCRRWHMRNG